MRPSKPLLRGTLIFIAGALVAGAAAFAASGGSDEIRTTSVSDGTPVLGIRPTGVGLPLTAAAGGTVGAGDIAASLQSYHDSGAYANDLAAVGDKARNYLSRRLSKLAAKKRRCEAASRRNHKPLARCRQPKLALVLDIDETALSNYSYLGDFTSMAG